MKQFSQTSSTQFTIIEFTLISTLPRFSKIKPPIWSSNNLVFSETCIFIARLRKVGKQMKNKERKNIKISNVRTTNGNSCLQTFASAFHPRCNIYCVTYETGSKIQHHISELKDKTNIDKILDFWNLFMTWTFENVVSNHFIKFNEPKWIDMFVAVVLYHVQS